MAQKTFGGSVVDIFAAWCLWHSRNQAACPETADRLRLMNPGAGGVALSICGNGVKPLIGLLHTLIMRNRSRAGLIELA